jgi:hypothetical protein
MKLKNLALAITATVASFSAVAETKYGELITNTATLKYSVAGGTSVTADSKTAVFNVDRLVKFNVTAESAANAEVGVNTVTVITLTNNSNASLNYSLPALTNVIYYNDLNGNGSLDSITEEIPGNVISPTDFITLSQNDGIATDFAKSYLAIYKPLVGVDGETQDITFTATAIENVAGFGTIGEVIVPTPIAEEWKPTTGQTVAETDAAGNFITSQSDTTTFTFVGANILLEKSVIVVSDPISRAESGKAPSGYVPKAIPGAILEYTITVTNSGAKDATLALTDTMPSIFSEADIDTSSYKQSINGAVASDISSNVAAATVNDIVTITFPSVTADKNDGTNNGTVVTTFEVKLP